MRCAFSVRSRLQRLRQKSRMPVIFLTSKDDEIDEVLQTQTPLHPQLVVFREIECRSMGASVCRVVGRHAAARGDVSEDLRYLQAQDFRSLAAPHPLPQAAPSEPLAPAAGADPVHLWRERPARRCRDDSVGRHRAPVLAGPAQGG